MLPHGTSICSETLIYHHTSIIYPHIRFYNIYIYVYIYMLSFWMMVPGCLHRTQSLILSSTIPSSGHQGSLQTPGLAVSSGLLAAQAQRWKSHFQMEASMGKWESQWESSTKIQDFPLLRWLPERPVLLVSTCSNSPRLCLYSGWCPQAQRIKAIIISC